MLGGSHYERPYGIMGPDGNKVYESATFAQGFEEFINSDTVAIGRGVAVILDQSGSTFPRWDYSTAGTDTIPTCVIKGKQVAAATSKCYLGVALEKVPVGAQGRVCTTGSLTAVLCLASPTAAALGGAIIGSSTPGSVDIVVIASATIGLKLGTCYVLPGTSAGQTGSTTQTIILVNQGP